MAGKLVLVIGGARSGKSSFAEKYVLNYGSKCAYIATAEILDEEMAERVKQHQLRRNGKRWVNFEAPYNADNTVAQAGEAADCILFDCLTLYLSNLMYGKNAPDTFEEKCLYVRNEVDKLLQAAKKTNKTVVFVSNDVGCGIVPDNQMAREYRDVAGWLNQQVGFEADFVFYVMAGQAVDIKKLAFKFEDNPALGE
ncbi:MAG: bifunctional adenosylcobinamide kinase/adenosylcobinamide-phosphate guanylyltransferase [Acidaminococcaceae bacterium]|nr:bifunctional adenosylcobinamide kinase/adenosylcobinamide-phosphate guanylyltransferase [Acidaminococcaceae bacterium]